MEIGVFYIRHNHNRFFIMLLTFPGIERCHTRLPCKVGNLVRKPFHGSAVNVSQFHIDMISVRR